MNPASATATLPGADDPRSAMATAANAPTPMSGACWLVQALAAEGVDTLFGYPGGAIMPFYDALHGAGLRHILVRHAQGAAFAANGSPRPRWLGGVRVPPLAPGPSTLPPP